MPYARELNVTSQYKSGFDRVRIDPGQTGFFEGRMFRTYDKLNILEATTKSYRFISPVPFILWKHVLQLRLGGLACTVFDSSAVPSVGDWTQLPIIGVNRMPERRAPFYVPQITVETGGSFTGGVELDYFELLSGIDLGNQQALNVSGENDERGLPNTTFYLRLSVLSGITGSSLGTHKLVWEERPASVPGWNPGDGVI